MLALVKRLKWWLFGLSRPKKRLVSVLADTLFILVALWGAYALRFETHLWFPDDRQLAVFGVTAVVSVAGFVKLGLYRAVIRYIGEKVLVVVMAGVAMSGMTLILSGFLFQALVPRSVPVLYGAFVFLLVAGSRFVIRSMINRPLDKARGRVLIVGAGPTALELSSALMQGTEYRPMGFVSLDLATHKSMVAGLQVYGIDHIQRAVREQGVQRVFLALEDDSRVDRKALIRRLEPLSVPVQTVPSMSELVAGQARINDIRDLDVGDLLGRNPIGASEPVVDGTLAGKSVMVTGAGGSIGGELCRQILRHRPRILVLFDQSEFSLYRIERELSAANQVEGLGVEVKPLLGSVVGCSSCERAMRAFRVQVVYHAAAYKHVPLVEHNLIEGVRNNVFGTWHAAEAAIRAKAERFVLISSDKAVRPANVMGASKRLAELVLQGLAQRQSETIFSMVRFGNVLGSSGSVVPLFRDQIRDGGPVTVTHPDITRYFMTIPEASQLVLQAGNMGKGGEVFVLDMGEPVKIADLARKMIRLMGFTERTEANPEGEIPVVYTGLRPGEKLYEELLIGDDPQGTIHPRIMMARESALPWQKVKELLSQLEIACQALDCEGVFQLLETSGLGYSPEGELADLVWCSGYHTCNGESATDAGKVRILYR
jgi:FlaA1/EpsC-like NDP-sugar epimerase